MSPMVYGARAVSSRVTESQVVCIGWPRIDALFRD